MQFFVDTAEIADIKKLYEMGLLDGVTTNPSLVAKSGRDFKEVVKEICAIVPGPVSAEVAAIDYDGMMAEGHVLAKLADNVVVKVPLTIDGLARHARPSAMKASRPTSRCASRPTRHCWRPNAARPTCRRSSDVSTTSISTASS